ncbi:MAG: CHAT domain-containing protein [Planctomycetota bacterium]
MRQADTHSRFVLEARLEYYLAIGSPSKVIDRLEREGGVGSELQGLFLGFALHILYVDGLKASREEAIAQLEFAAGALPVRQSLDARLLLIELYLDVEHQPSDNAYDLERATAEIQTCDKLLLEHPWPEQAARLEAFRARIGPRTTAQLQRQFETLGGLLRLWRRTPAQADGLGFLTNYHRRVIVSELIESLLALRGPGPGAEAAVGVLLKTQALASGAREAGVAKVTLDEVRRDLLVNGQGMLLFFPGRFRSHLLAVGHNVVKAFTLPRFPRLVQPIDALRNRLRESPVGWTVEDEARWAEQLTGPARELAKQLLPDEATALLHDWNCVTVVDQGMLRDLPLEALVMEDGTLVGERFAINHLGSLPFGVHLQRTRWHPPTRDALDLDLLATLRGSPELLGDKAGPSFDFGPWRSTLDDIFGDVHVVPEDHLTVTALPEQKLTGDVHHFVMHGAHDRRRGRSPGIALVPEGPDDRGLFGTAEAAQLRAAPLVVLSVCRSAQGVTARIGDEPILDSLGGGVLHARNSRCHSVVQSAADLKLRPHLELMAEVFRNIHAGDPVAVALQRARAAARQRGPDAARFRHAQVQVTGLGHRRLRQ